MRWFSLQLFAFCSKCFSSVASSLCLSPTSTPPPPTPPPQSETLQINPLHTLIPSTMCVSFGVMLPVGNPPNAIVFSYGHVQISDMVWHMHTQMATCTFCTCGIKGRASVRVDLCNWKSGLFNLTHWTPFRLTSVVLRWKQVSGWTWLALQLSCWPSPPGVFLSLTWPSSRPGRWPGTSPAAYNHQRNFSAASPMNCWTSYWRDKELSARAIRAKKGVLVSMRPPPFFH